MLRRCSVSLCSQLEKTLIISVRTHFKDSWSKKIRELERRNPVRLKNSPELFRGRGAANSEHGHHENHHQHHHRLNAHTSEYDSNEYHRDGVRSHRRHVGRHRNEPLDLADDWEESGYEFDKTRNDRRARSGYDGGRSNRRPIKECFEENYSEESDSYNTRVTLTSTLLNHD